MNKPLGPLTGFPIEKFKNMPPPDNESIETEEEIDYLDSIPVEDKFVHSADEVYEHFEKFLKTKGLEFPEEDLEISDEDLLLLDEDLDLDEEDEPEVYLNSIDPKVKIFGGACGAGTTAPGTIS